MFIKGLNRYLKCVRTRKASACPCDRPDLEYWLKPSGSFLVDYSLTHDPPYELPVPLVTAGTAELQALLKP